MEANPFLVDVSRGALVESRHRGRYVVCDADGRIVARAGDIESPVFPRSAIKFLQALPLVESGAAADGGALTHGEPLLVEADAGGVGPDEREDQLVVVVEGGDAEVVGAE